MINIIVKKLMESRRLNEMAIINPPLCRQCSIQVEVEQRNEGPIPHLHVYLDKTRNPRNCSFVRLDKAEYAPHHKGKPLKGTKREEFLDIMKSVWSKSFIQANSGAIRKATGYEAAVQTWIDTYGETIEFEYDEDGIPIMPDYENHLP